MKINRSNYEIWFIDWLEGNLCDNEIDNLKLFLSGNPDLEEEFRELISLSIKPSVKAFPHKHLLKKSTSDLSASQFEYLCVASLENDLPSDQKEELIESFDQDPVRKNTFELIQRTILTPPKIRFKRKKLILKRTAFQKVFRLSVIGLSAAASIALIIATYITIPQSRQNPILADHDMLYDNYGHQPSTDYLENEPTDENTLVIPPENTGKLYTVIKISGSPVNLPEVQEIFPDDTFRINPGNNHNELKKVPVNLIIDFKGITGNTLITSKTSPIIPPDNDGHNKLGKFIAKTFREKILKENPSPASPLSGYEIAEAGVAGVNKLLGWEMALNINDSGNGESHSVYFSSRILKFNTPVKKRE